MFGVAANCVVCKVLASQVFFNADKARVCSDCIQKEYDHKCVELQRAANEASVLTKKNQELEKKVELYDSILEQIKNFTRLIKKE